MLFKLGCAVKIPLSAGTVRRKSKGKKYCSRVADVLRVTPVRVVVISVLSVYNALLRRVSTPIICEVDAPGEEKADVLEEARAYGLRKEMRPIKRGERLEVRKAIL